MQYSLDTIGSIKICQPREGYRFSVDSLLLADFVNLKHLKKAADIGAGTGIIGIILAKKYPNSQIAMIEIQKQLAELAEESVRLNDLSSRIRVLCMDARQFDEKGFDLVVSNPPFRRPGTGRLSPNEDRALARHEITLTVQDIAIIAEKLLHHRGRLCIIHLPERFIEIVRIMSKHNLEIKRIRLVHSKMGTPAKMVLIEAVKGGRVALKVEPPLFIYKNDGSYTDEMQRIYSI